MLSEGSRFEFHPSDDMRYVRECNLNSYDKTLMSNDYLKHR